jgi:predicted DNA-binding protein (UPF0251 family)
MASEFIPTPELCEAIKLMAYNGLSMEEIAQKLGRQRDTIFYNSEEKSAEVKKAYLDGKRSNKEDLLRKAAELTDTADSDSVKFNAIKYNLAIKHKVIEKQEQDITSGGQPIIGFITRAKE